MSEWPQIPLGSVARVVPGYAFKSRDWCDNGVPVLKIKNIQGDGSIDVENVDYVPPAILSPRLKRFEVRDNDILLAMTGATAGKVGKLRSTRHFMLNQRVAKLIPVDIDPTFFWSLVSSDEYQDRFFRLADGAAQPNMSGAQIEGVLIPLPPPPTQHRIASILGAYDDLIEVNRRRIAVLEEMARGLFEEWFIRFRFPGHEDVPILDTPDGPLPEGWKRVELGALVELAYGKALKATERVPGAIPVIGSSGVVGSHVEAYQKGPSIVLGRKGNVGAVIWTATDFWPIDTVYFIRSDWPLIFLLQLLQRISFQNTDAAVPGLNRTAALKKIVAIPSYGLAERYDEHTRPMRDLVDQLLLTNERLSASRALILPRLISGQLSVELAERELEEVA